MHGRFPLRARPQVVLDITSTPAQSDGNAYGYVHCLQDVSKMDEFIRAKDEYLLNVAHELEGPLASWRAALDLFIEDYMTLSTRDLGVMLRNLQRTTIKFQGLVETLIDIGKVQAGRFVVQLAPVPFERILRDATSQIEPLLKTKGQRLEIRNICPPDCIVMADRVRVIQVLVNLLKNASKYGPEDQAIELVTCRDFGYVFIAVTDHGPGIPPEEQAQLFQRFFRGTRAEEEGAGIGLGLALAKGITEAHGGRINVQSRVGEGTTFWFSIPEKQEQ
jgi:signal transduction histidine kinase